MKHIHQLFSGATMAVLLSAGVTTNAFGSCPTLSPNFIKDLSDPHSDGFRVQIQAGQEFSIGGQTWYAKPGALLWNQRIKNTPMNKMYVVAHDKKFFRAPKVLEREQGAISYNVKCKYIAQNTRTHEIIAMFSLVRLEYADDGSQDGKEKR